MGAGSSAAEPQTEQTNAAEAARKKAAEDRRIDELYQQKKATLSPERQAWETLLDQNLGNGFYLPAHKRDFVKGVSTAWDFVPDDPKLPRVLLIGDSVSRGYTLAARAALAGKANVHRAPENCGPTANGVKKLEVWLGAGKWDVIHFNFGIHDRATPLADYETRLGDIIARLQKTGAKLIWASTTPIPRDEAKKQIPESIVERNAIAVRLAEQRGIAVNDLFAFITPHLATTQNPNDVHFNPRGYELLGQQVARAIAAEFPPLPSRGPTYKLPELLALFDETRVTDAKTWTLRRRPELLELFRKHVYGRSPGRPERLTFKVVEEDPRALKGTATRREVDIAFPGPRGTFTFRLVIYLPNKANKPVPAFLLLNHRGNVSGQVNNPFFPVDQIIARGYAAAGITLGQLSPDKADTYRDGVLGFIDGPEERSPDAWRTIAAWAWGGSRAMDYFETDKDIDSKRVAVLGHSRGGKTALWCGAEDERFALTISNNSGETGAALARRGVGQSLAIGNIRNPHWFATNFKRYNDQESELPVDQHELIALLTPRLAYVASAET
ncbi:MAG: GDSL-type esterase/lipase family protein, partial [Burkholderiales bacterium]